MKKSVRILIIVLILLFGIGIAVIFMITRPKPESRAHTDPGKLVSVMTAKSSDITMTVDGFGTVRPKKEVALTAEVSGKVAKLSDKLDEGMFFKKGDLLLEIDRRSYDLDVKQIKSRIEQQEAELGSIKQEIENNKINLKIASNELELNSKEWERYKKLKADKVVSDTEADAIELKYLQSKNNKQTIENTLKTLETKKTSASASLNSAKVELEDAQLSLSKTRFYAPFDGRTAQRFVDENQFVGIGTPLVKIYSTAAVEVTIQLPIDELRWLESDTTLEILNNTSKDYENILEKRFKATAYLDTESGVSTWKGFIDRFGGVVDETTRTVPVVVKFSDPWGLSRSEKYTPLVPGMFVRIEIEGAHFENIYQIPRSAIRPDDTVYIADGEQLKIRPVAILRTIDNTAYVKKGLKEGEQIIISPLSVATDGMKIRIKKEEK